MANVETALYNKYRPRLLKDVVGQDHIKQTLENSANQNKIGHAYLFAGPKGTGKTSLARILACMVNCEEAPSVDYDIENGICKSIIQQSCPDIQEVDGASQKSIDEIREIRKSAQLSPMYCNRKVFILDEAQNILPAAASVLLKVLEEPPASSMFILATTNPQKILPTLRSRCQRFDLKRLKTQQIVGRLQQICDFEKVEVENPNCLTFIAKSSYGSMRDALSFLDAVIGRCGKRIKENEIVDILGLSSYNSVFTVFYHVCNGDITKAILEEKKLVSNGSDPLDVFNSLLGVVHDIMIAKTLKNDSFLMIDDSIRDKWESLLNSISALALAKTIEKIIESISRSEYIPRVDSLLDSCIIELITLIKINK